MNATYLDHAATTPVRPEVLNAMMPFFGERFGNPSSTHAFGRAARMSLEEARERIAAALGVRRSEIVFTSGGTEADNLAVLGRKRLDIGPVAVSAVEHKAVLTAAKGGILIGVDSNGTVELDTVDEVLKNKPALVSVMWVNNEVGTIQPVEQIAARCAASDVVFHTDAVQAIGRVPVRLHDGITMLSLSGHKLGAPKGIGALFVREGTQLVPSQQGGSQERGLRPGTENIASAIGLSLAVELAVKEQATEAERLRALRNRLAEKFEIVNGGGAPHILNVTVPGAEQDALMVMLDLEGVAVSTASACQSGAAEPSHVLAAMGRVIDNGAVIRMSLGRTTTDADITRAIEVFEKVSVFA